MPYILLVLIVFYLCLVRRLEDIVLIVLIHIRFPSREAARYVPTSQTGER